MKNNQIVAVSPPPTCARAHRDHDNSCRQAESSMPLKSSCFCLQTRMPLMAALLSDHKASETLASIRFRERVNLECASEPLKGGRARSWVEEGRSRRRTNVSGPPCLGQD